MLIKSNFHLQDYSGQTTDKPTDSMSDYCSSCWENSPTWQLSKHFFFFLKDCLSRILKADLLVYKVPSRLVLCITVIILKFRRAGLGKLLYTQIKNSLIGVNVIEPPPDKINKMACAPSKDSDQPGHPPSLIRVFAVHMKKAWVLSYPLSEQRRLLIRLGGCPCWSESLLGAHAILFVLSRCGSYDSNVSVI